MSYLDFLVAVATGGESKALFIQEIDDSKTFKSPNMIFNYQNLSLSSNRKISPKMVHLDGPTKKLIDSFKHIVEEMAFWTFFIEAVDSVEPRTRCYFEVLVEWGSNIVEDFLLALSSYEPEIDSWTSLKYKILNSQEYKEFEKLITLTKNVVLHGLNGNRHVIDVIKDSSPHFDLLFELYSLFYKQIKLASFKPQISKIFDFPLPSVVDRILLEDIFYNISVLSKSSIPKFPEFKPPLSKNLKSLEDNLSRSLHEFKMTCDQIVCNQLFFNSDELTSELKEWFSLFFIQQADWLSTFFDLSLSELEKPVSKVLLHRVDAVLKTIGFDSFKTVFVPTTLEEPNAQPRGDLLGVRCFTLSRVQKSTIPAFELFVTANNLEKYQNVFRLLLVSHWTIRKLSSVWVDFHRASLGLRASQLLTRLTHICTGWLSFTTNLVNSRSFKFFQSLKEPSNFKNVLSQHENMLDEIQTALFLKGEPILLRQVTKLLSTAALFSSHLKRYIQVSGGKKIDEENAKFKDLLIKFEETFNKQVIGLLENLQTVKEENPIYAELIDLIDFNGFYSSRGA
jgi:Gamma tubulin complex component C-terminal